MPLCFPTVQKFFFKKQTSTAQNDGKKRLNRDNVNSENFKSLNINAEAVKCLFPHMVTTIVCVYG